MAMKYLPNLLLAGIALASFYSCEYDTFKDMQPENVNPTLVAPLINDTLTIGDLVQREGEKSTVKFDASGLSYVESYSQNLLPIKNLTGVKKIEPPLSPSALSVAAADLAIPHPVLLEVQFVPGTNLSKVLFTATEAKVRIEFSASSAAPEDKLKLKLGYGSETKEVEISKGAYNDVDVTEWLTGKEIALQPGTSAVDIDKLEVKVSEITEVTGDVELKLSFWADGIDVQKAYGKTLMDLSYNLGGGVKLSQYTFDNTFSAKMGLHDIRFLVTVKKPRGFHMVMKVGSVVASNQKLVDDDDLKAGVNVQNQGTLGAKDFQIGQENDLPAEADSVVLELNAQNSNVGDLFGRGANSLLLDQVSFEAKGVEEGWIPLGQTQNLGIKVESIMPFDGWIQSNAIRQTMRIPSDVFGQIGLDNAALAKYRMENRSIKLKFYTLNAMPFNIYANFVFVDDKGAELYRLTFDGKEKFSGTPSLPMFIKAGQVQNGRVTAPSEYSCEAPITVEQYEKIAASASALVAEYVFNTPKAQEQERVQVYKKDYLRLAVGIEAQMAAINK